MALLPSHATVPQDALHDFDCLFYALFFKRISLSNYMPTTFLTLFPAMVCATPIAPRGTVLKALMRRGGECADVFTSEWLPDWIL